MSRDTDRAGIEVTLSHHDAAQCDQRGGGESIFLSTEQRGNHNVPPRLQLTIRLDTDATSQVIFDKGLMRFRKPQFPRQTRVFDAGEW